MEYVLEEKSVEVGGKIKMPKGSKIVGWQKEWNGYIIIYLKPVR